MSQATLRRFSRSRLLNQLGNYRAFAPPPASPSALVPTENPVYEYQQNIHACASTAAAMAFRSLISYSQGGFGLLRSTSNYAPQNAGNTAPPAITRATAFNYDWYDIFLMNQLATLIGAVGKNSDPAEDGNVTKGIGRIFGLATEFVDTAKADFRWTYRKVTSINIPGQITSIHGWPVLNGYYPFIDVGAVKTLLNNCTQIIIVYLVCPPLLDASNMPVLDPNNNPIYDVRLATEHAIIVNGWTTDPMIGDVFMTFDPWGAPFNPPTVFAGRIFANPDTHQNGAWEYVQFSHQQAPTAFLHYASKPMPTDFVVLSVQGDSKFGHPFFIANACGADGGSSLYARAVTGMGTLSLKNDHTNIDAFTIDTATICTPASINTPPPHTHRRKPDIHSGDPGPVSEHSPPSVGSTAPGVIKIPGKK